MILKAVLKTTKKDKIIINAVVLGSVKSDKLELNSFARKLQPSCISFSEQQVAELCRAPPPRKGTMGLFQH